MGALGVMSGKIRSGSKWQICMDMFPHGAPSNADNNPTWQSCKQEVGGYSSAWSQSLLEWNHHGTNPLTDSDRQAVGNALSQALGVMSGKIKSGSKFQICMDMFPNGAPSNADSDPTWQACKGEFSSSWKRSFIERNRRLRAATNHAN